MTERASAGFGVAAILLLLAAVPARAEIQDYMIRRLVYLNTQCGIESLERLESGSGSRRFKITCRNVSLYPDGLTVACGDIDDDRTCVVETREKEFKALRLLQPGPDGP